MALEDIKLKLHWSESSVEVGIDHDVCCGSGLWGSGKTLAEALERLAKQVRTTDLVKYDSVWLDSRIR